jgi:UPF0271 protein
MAADLNCDMGEGCSNDALLMPFITSANIACGYHAGDTGTIEKTITLCLQHKVHIGAHPSFPDRANFGRTAMKLSPKEIYELIIQQLVIFSSVVEIFDAQIHHIKPHGALYNMAAGDASIAACIARAVKDFDHSLILYGLSGSELIKQAENSGLKTASEVFADRTYRDDGTLQPRSLPNALIEDEATAVTQVLQMLEKGTVTSVSGKEIPIKAETICVHGDGAKAVEFVKALHTAIYQP